MALLDRLELSSGEKHLREDVRRWIANHQPTRLVGHTSDDIRLYGSDEQQKTLALWTDLAAQEGYVCSSWPVEYGGRDLTQREVAILTVEFAEARLPRPTRGAGESLVGPAVIRHGTEEQKRRLLPRIISGEDVYCQGFSEPDAGSDLAGLRTVGRVDGEEIHISGQKIWTSGAHKANHIFVLCRTDAEAPKHRGISYVVVPMEKTTGEPNGIEIRPIKQMTGAERFFETFFTEAVAPLTNVIGGLNEGWRTAMTTLSNERAGRAANQYLDAERDFDGLVSQMASGARQMSAAERQHLAQLNIELNLIRLNTLRSLNTVATNEVNVLAAIHKLQWSEYVQEFANFAVDVAGLDAILLEPGSAGEHWATSLLHNRCHTIWGGTSEVQRNIIAERVLGLPKEPR